MRSRTQWSAEPSLTRCAKAHKLRENDAVLPLVILSHRAERLPLDILVVRRRCRDAGPGDLVEEYVDESAFVRLGLDRVVRIEAHDPAFADALPPCLERLIPELPHAGS